MLVLGIDPGIAKGKPMAMVLVDTDGPRVMWWCDRATRGSSLFVRLADWRIRLGVSALVTVGDTDYSPDLVAIEDARGPSGSAHALQTLVEILCEECEALGIPCELVHNSKGRAVLRRLGGTARGMEGAEGMPPEDDYDAAISIALAGEAIWRKKQMQKEE